MISLAIKAALYPLRNWQIKTEKSLLAATSRDFLLVPVCEKPSKLMIHPRLYPLNDFHATKNEKT
jgi:hypothetical protein